MNSPKPDIEYLLSGMLDGTLSEEDANLLNREIAKDSSLLSQLDELSAIRRSLLSGRTVAYLGSDFASSVTKAAKKRASEIGADAPEWLKSRERKSLTPNRPDTGRLIAPVPKVQPQWIRWTYASVLAVATCFVLVAFSLPKSAKQGFVSNFKPGSLGDEPSRLNGSDYSDTKQAAEDSEKVTELLTEKLAKDTGAKTQDVMDPFDVAEMELNKIADAKAELAIVPEPSEKAGPVVAESPQSKKASDQVPDSKLSGLATNMSYFVMVLDLSVDPLAIENRMLERILEKHGIVFTDDLVLSDEQVKQLVDARLVGDSKAAEQDNMGVLFLRSSGEKLGLAMLELEAQYQDFPDYAFGMVGDDSAMALVKQLQGVRVAEGTDGSAQRLAKSKSQETKSPFAASVPRFKAKSKESRLGSAKRSPLIPVDGMSSALILIRPAKN